MIIAAHQPNFLPNLAFFNKMKLVDLFIIIGNIQFEKHEGWQQRHKIKGANGDIWLTVPVFGSQNQLIKDVKINNQLNWRRKHIKTLETVYGRSKEKRFLAKIMAIYSKDWKKLMDFNVELVFLFREFLGIKTPIVVDKKVSGAKHVLITAICKKYHADTYLSGVGAKDYLDEKKLSELKKQVIDHRFISKDLTSIYPYSTLHYLLTQGKDWVKDVIQ